MRVRYSVERVSPLEAEPQLRALWSRNLQIASSADKADWLYRRAPWPAPEAFLLRATQPDGTSEAVGTAGVFIRRMRVAGQMIEAGLLGDFAVDVTHRTLMPALTLMRTVRAQARMRYGLLYGFPNPLAVGVCRRVGYIELGKMTRYVRVLRHDRFVRRVLDVPVLSTVGARLVDATRILLSLPAAERALRGRRLDWIDRQDRPDPSLDARLEVLWRDAQREYTIVGERSPAFVRWRFLEHPTERCQLVLLSTPDRSRLLAYAAVLLGPSEVGGKVAHVRDLFGYRDEVGHILDALLPLLWRRGFTTVSMRVGGDEALTATLLARGFVAREQTRTVVVEPGESLHAQSAIVTDARAWYLTDADEDT